MLGGGMRQVGVLAAAGLVALEEGPKRLQQDHDNAKVLAAELAAIPGIGLDPAKVQTNIIIFSVKPGGLTSAQFLSRLKEQGVLAVPVDADRVRMVTHLDVSRDQVVAAADAVRQALPLVAQALPLVAQGLPLVAQGFSPAGRCSE
jgi:threonine aldolase